MKMVQPSKVIASKFHNLSEKIQGSSCEQRNVIPGIRYGSNFRDWAISQRYNAGIILPACPQRSDTTSLKQSLRKKALGSDEVQGWWTFKQGRIRVKAMKSLRKPRWTLAAPAWFYN